MMRIRNLQTFLKVAELENFHAAAKAIDATQPAISSRIAALEADLGVTLFSRDQGGTRLTSRGYQLVPYAQKLVNLSEEMKHLLQKDMNDDSTMRIGIADTLAQLWVGPLLKNWRDEFPHVEFEVVIDISDNLMDQVTNHELDMVLMVAQPANDILLSEHLCSYKQVWVASDEFIEEKNLGVGAVNLWQLSTCSVLSFPKNTQPWNYLDRLFSAMGEERPMLHTCSSVNHLMNLTEQGLGVSLLPEPLAMAMKEKGQSNVLNIADEVNVPDLDFSCGWRLDDDRLMPKLLAEVSRSIIQGKPLKNRDESKLDETAQSKSRITI